MKGASAPFEPCSGVFGSSLFFLYYIHNVYIIKLDMASVGNPSIKKDPSTDGKMWVCKYSLDELSDNLKHINVEQFNWSSLLYIDSRDYRYQIAKREGKEYVKYDPQWDEITDDEYDELNKKIMMVVKYVLDNGADPNGWKKKRKGPDGSADVVPLVKAAFYSKTPDIVNLLLEGGARADIPAQYYNEFKFPLASAIDRSRGRPFPPNIEIVKALVNKGRADVNDRDFLSFDGGRGGITFLSTPLHYALNAVPYGSSSKMHPINVDIIKFLLEKGANPYIESMGIRAWPIHDKSPEIVQLFRDHLRELSEEFETSFSNNGDNKRQRHGVVSTLNIRF